MKRLNSRLLEKATYVCQACGDEFGNVKGGRAEDRVSRHMDACDICCVVGPVAHVRNYGWLIKGMQRLKCLGKD